MNKICPHCLYVIEYDPYFDAYICRKCYGYWEENRKKEIREALKIPSGAINAKRRKVILSRS